MNSKQLSHRVRPGQLILIPLLLVGIGLAWWAHKANEQSADRSTRLNVLRDRICGDVMQISVGLQGLALDLKNDASRKKARDAQTDLGTAIEFLERDFHERTNVVAVARNLQSFFSRLIDQAVQDTPAAIAAYHRNFPSIESQQDELLRELNDEVAAADAAEAAVAGDRETIVVGGIIVILLACGLAIWLQSAAMARPLEGLTETLDCLRRGDFTRRFRVDGFEQLRDVGEGLNGLAEDLSALVGQVQRSGLQVNATASQIAETAKEQQSTAHEIAATTAEIGATSKQISNTSRELVKTIDEVSTVAKEAGQLANSGQTAIARMESTMRQIMEAAGAIGSKLAALSDKTAAINSVVTTITKVADQTNLLSLNAAIEAEKAGEYGLGFAVVAVEIRRLADQTAVATYDIEKTVKEMQSAVAAGVMGMDKFSEEVRRGVEEIRQVSTQLGQIIREVQALTPRFEIVNEGMHAQAAGAQQISDTLAQLSEAARQTADSLHESNRAIDQLNEAARGLQTSVVRFKLQN